MPIADKLTERSALDVVDLLKRGEVTPSEVLAAQRARAEAVEPRINAIVTTCWDRAADHAKRLDQMKPEARGPLCGLPVTIKDLTPVGGVRTTFGSPIFAEHVPEESEDLVQRLEAQDGVVSGITNSPEFGAGGNTFNEVFGATRNPWNLAKSAGGSSGGAAASLAARSSWLSVGSDHAGSLRTPASFCGVVGLRPTPGRIPPDPAFDPFAAHGVDGPMARDVADVAFLLDRLAALDPSAPLSLPLPEGGFLSAARKPREKARIAVSADLGLGTVLPPAAEAFQSAVTRLEGSGFDLRSVDLDLRMMDAAYRTLRGVDFVKSLGGHMRDRPDMLKPEIVWNVEFGLKQTGEDVARAMATRAAGYQALMAAMGDADVLICPATITPAFDVEHRYWGAQFGLGYEHYLDWLSLVYVVTPFGVPVLALPCAMTAEGLPFAMQVIARPRAEADLLAVGAAMEMALSGWSVGQMEIDRA